MKNSILISAVLLLLSTSVFSQYGIDSYEKEAFHKNITIELGGSHILWGLNYDMRLKRGRNDGFGFKAGIGGGTLNKSVTEQGELKTIDAGYLTIPIEFNHVLGKRRHGLVTGLGILGAYGSVQTSGFDTEIRLSGLGVVGAYANLGYRFQPIDSGFTFQINLNPHILRGGAVLPYAGISFGYGFK